jgi:hypothetical protein
MWVLRITSVESQSQADFLYLLEVLFIPVLDWNPFLGYQ